MATDKMSFLVIGDLSFFYAMNAIAIKHKKNNIRIMLINNGGGAEFHIVPSSNAIPTIDKHIGELTITRRKAGLNQWTINILAQTTKNHLRWR